MSNIADLRKEYKLKALNESDADADPFIQFTHWWNDALNSKIEEVNAMTLCTVSENRRPQGRIVLIKDFDEKGFVFFTNYNSNKGTELLHTPFASLVFFWKELERQVRISGSIIKIPESESDTYFKSRPVASQLGAWASPQSQPIADRAVLENNMEQLQEKYINTEIPRPEHWGGYLLKPDAFEFWQGRPSRLHDRIAYAKSEDVWRSQRLAP